MKVAGEATLRAHGKEVWTALHDPALLAQAVPGCEWLEVTGPGNARFSLRLEMAPVAGRFLGEISIVDERDLEYITFAASATGAAGSSEAEVTFRLAHAEGTATTTVFYQAAGVLGGPIGAADLGLLERTAASIASDFLAAVERRLAETADSLGAGSASPHHGGPGRQEADTRPGYARAGGPAVAARDGRPPLRIPDAGRPRIATAFGAGVVLGLGGVIVAALLGRRNGTRKPGP